MAGSSSSPICPSNINISSANCTKREGVVAGSGPNLLNIRCTYVALIVPMREEWWQVLALVLYIYLTNIYIAPTVPIGKEW